MSFFRYLPEPYLLLASFLLIIAAICWQIFDDYKNRNRAKHVCRKLIIWEESWIFQSLCQKSIDAVRLVFNVDKVYRKRNKLVVLALIYLCIWSKTVLPLPISKKTWMWLSWFLSFTKAISIYVLDLMAFFLFWFCCYKFYASNLFRSVYDHKNNISLNTGYFIWQAPSVQKIYISGLPN